MAREVITQNKLKKQSSNIMNNYSSYINVSKQIKKVVQSYTVPEPKTAMVSQDTFIVKNDKSIISIPTTSIGTITLNKIIPKASKMAATALNNKYKLSVSLPNQGINTFSKKASMASDNSVVYTNYGEDTDVVVQAFDNSVKILTIINSEDAPIEYIYDVSIPIGGKMKKIDNGGIFIVDKNDKFVGGFAPAWAIDKNGEEVPTHFEIRGDILVQVVEHLNKNFKYPIVADPYWGHELILAYEWNRRRDNNDHIMYGKNDWVLSVFPTYWARVIGAGSYDVGYAGFSDLTYWGAIYYNYYGMRDQYICHQQYAFWRPGGWHLDEWRPDVGYWNTIQSYCNP